MAGDVVELVERKGLGHPDTVADGIAELASARYSRYCRERFGAVLHHNLDKVAVFGGRAVFAGNTGEYVAPVRVVFGGRASSSFAGEEIPVRELLTEAAHEQLRLALPGYERTLVAVEVATTDTSKFEHWFRPRSLADLPERGRLRCNDSAYLVASTRSPVETSALLVEAWLAEQSWTGSDIKVLAIQQRGRLDITVRVPALVAAAGSPTGIAEFRDLLRSADHRLSELLGAALPELEVAVRCNHTEHPAETGPLAGDYVTVSGSALDYGEDGMTGRGGDRHGLITPGRQCGNEATFGKNPTYHVGKVGAWLLDRTEATVAKEIGPCRVAAAWRIGTSFAEPAFLEVTGPTDPAARQVAPRVLAELAADAPRAWVDDIVDAECYRPRPIAVAELAAELRHARGA